MAGGALTGFSRHRERLALLPAVVCGCLGVITPALADVLAPFPVSNQNPLIQIHNIPAAGRAVLLAADEREYHWSIDHASSYVSKQNAQESLLLDGETTRLAFNFSQGLAHGWEWGVQIPYVLHRPGFLDAAIIDWHDLLGLPQGGRNDAPRNRLLYRYDRDGVTHVLVDEADDGIGDIRLSAGWQWQEGASQNSTWLALRAALSLPTGDADQLHGSGAASLALWLSGARTGRWLDRPSGLFGGAGMLLLDRADVLPELQEEQVLFASLGGGLQLSPRVGIKLQFDGHTRVYEDSSLVPVSADALQVVFGLDAEWSPGVELSLAVSEDLVVGASPDVVFHLGLRVRSD